MSNERLNPHDYIIDYVIGLPNDVYNDSDKKYRDEFILNIDKNKFKSTNESWNNLMLNDPWSVGYVTTLIEQSTFATKEEWETYYYSSGEERKSQILKLNQNTQNILENELAIKNNKDLIKDLGYGLKNLNTQYGRTKEEFKKKGLILYESVKNNGLGLTIEECIECVRFRVICETWNGVIVREKNTINNLQNLFKDFDFIKVSGEVDYNYAVDYEVYKKNVLKFAIQIKPVSYTWNTPYILKAKKTNKQKNLKYTEKYGIEVIDIISDSRGNIQNIDALKKFTL